MTSRACRRPAAWRAGGEGSTEIRFASLELDPLTIGSFTTAGTFTCPEPTGDHARPVSAIDVDSKGTVYVASAEDLGDDNGPFRSAVYAVGKVRLEDGEPKVALDDHPRQLAILDAVKVESIAIREQPGRNIPLLVGLDDENYGGTMRPIPLQP